MVDGRLTLTIDDPPEPLINPNSNAILIFRGKLQNLVVRSVRGKSPSNSKEEHDE